MRAAIYARFSSENQREQSIDDQIRVCKEYANKNDVTILENHIYTDEAKSGSINNRPGLEGLKKAAENKLFDAVIVDDASRLSRDNQYFNTLLCLLQFWGIELISVSDGLNTKEEHAKVAYQFRGIFNELYLTDLKKKTHRGQMGQILRGFTVGGLCYGYKSIPVGESKYDQKGRLRADGFKAEIVPEEARIIKRIFSNFSSGKAINAIVKELNDEKIQTRKQLKGGWNISTVSRILKNEKYIGKYVWNKSTSVKDPLTGKRKKVERQKSEWVVQNKPEMQIIPNELWETVQKRWKEIENIYPHQQGKKGFVSQQDSYVKSHPPHLLSGSLECGECKGSIALVSGKGSGYYGCLNGYKKSCTNRMMISRKKLEKYFIHMLYEKVLTPETLDTVYQKTAQKIKDQFCHIPEEIRLKKIELNRAETRAHNFIEFIAEGKATEGLSFALEQAETKAKEFKKDLEALEQSKDSAFTPPPIEWIQHKLQNLSEVLAQKTENSALVMRRLTGKITLTPKKPEVGKPYYHARTKIKSFALLEKMDAPVKPWHDKEVDSPVEQGNDTWENSANSLQVWRRWESNPRPKILGFADYMLSLSFKCTV